MRLSQYYGRVEFDGRRGRPTIRTSHVDFQRTIYRVPTGDPPESCRDGVKFESRERPAT